MSDQSRNDAVYLRGVADGIIQIIPDELARIADDIERLTKERDSLRNAVSDVLSVSGKSDSQRDRDHDALVKLVEGATHG